MAIRTMNDESDINIEKLRIPEGALPDLAYLVVIKSKYLYMEY